MKRPYLEKIFSKFNKYLIYFLIITLVVAISFPQLVKAAPSMTAISDTMSRLKANTLSSHVMKFTTGDPIATNADTITFTFPSDFDFTAKAINTVTFTHGATTGLETTETLAASATDSVWGAEFSGTENRVFTLTAPTDGIGSAAVAAGDKIIISYTSANSTNPTSANNYVVTIVVAGSTSESGSFAVPIITDDQVVVSTTIDPYVTFTLTTNTVTLTKAGGGNPDSANTGYNQGAANTLEAYTNAGSGYTITYFGDTLKTAGGAEAIDAMAAKAASATNSEQFGINLRSNTTPTTGTDKSGSGSGTYSSDYGTVDQYRYIVNTTTSLATAAAATLSNIFTVTYIVNVSQTTAAGAYSTTITYICTGNF